MLRQSYKEQKLLCQVLFSLNTTPNVAAGQCEKKHPVAMTENKFQVFLIHSVFSQAEFEQEKMFAYGLSDS